MRVTSVRCCTRCITAVLEDMRVKQVKTVSTFNIAIFSYSLFCLSVYSANLCEQIYNNVILCMFCNRSSSDKPSQKPKHRMLIKHDVKK